LYRSWISFTSGWAAMFRSCAFIALWFSGKSTTRIITPNTTSTHPYPMSNVSCRYTRIVMMMPTKGRISGRKTRHPYGLTSSMP
jgi:hypothetical protein